MSYFNTIDGIQVQIEKGIGFDAHWMRSYTETFGSTNIFDVIGGIKKSLGFN